MTQEERHDEFVLAMHDTVRSEHDRGLHDLQSQDCSEERCYCCGEKQGLSPKGYFMCEAPAWPCEMKGVMQRMCYNCDEIHPIEYGHYYCEVCASCYDSDDPCPFH